MDNEDLLAEIEDLMRNIPDRSSIWEDTTENHSWFGRLAAVIEAWNFPKTVAMSGYLHSFHTGNEYVGEKALRQIMTLMHQCRSDLRMKTFGPTNIAIEKGMVFCYFDEVRKIIETAKTDILFIDPYLDAEFVSRYLGNVQNGVKIRLLAREKIRTLVPAAESFSKQTSIPIEIRTSKYFHDRYVIVDGKACYQSGASFKDGAKKTPTTLTEITDAFPAVKSTYEDMWKNANVII